MSSSTDVGVIRPLIHGAIAGAVGTLALVVLRRVITPAVVPTDMRQEQQPPEQIVEWAEAKAGEPVALSNPEKMATAMVAHFGYGMTGGALYGVARSRFPGVSAPITGAIFGLAVWAVSLEGLLPMLGVAPATTNQMPKKWVMPVIDHLSYGVITALAYESLAR